MEKHKPVNNGFKRTSRPHSLIEKVKVSPTCKYELFCSNKVTTEDIGVTIYYTPFKIFLN